MVPLIRIRSVSLHLQWSFFLVINGLSNTSIYLCILPSYPIKFLIPLFSLFLFSSIPPFHSVPNRDIPKLGTSHLSFLILILSPLSSHFVWFTSLHSVSKSKNKLKFYTKNYYPILSKSPLPSFPFPYPPFLFPSGHPEPPNSPNPPHTPRGATPPARP